ncbi:glycosyltransferase [Bacillus sp. FSL R12-0069]|uniref:glycosyltransferase n=1 Tax=Bacillus sp. FSL R12-0069 TaxID=2975342 RepID=UPI0030FC6F76
MEQPLVSVLIPVTGNRMYLELALTSVLLQTYTNLEIIIRDPTPTDQIQIWIEKEFLPYSNKIKYIREPIYLSKVNILQKLIGLSSGEYINIMMEKDILYPTKIERMMDHFLTDNKKGIQLVTSNVAYVDMHGDKKENTSKMYHQDIYWDKVVIYNHLLKYSNYIGGISAPLFRKHGLVQEFGVFENQLFTTEIELASWLTLASQGSFVFLEEELTFERRKIKDIPNKITFNRILDWVHLLTGVKQKNYVITKGTINYIIKKIIKWIDYLLNNKQNALTLQDRDKLQAHKEYIYSLLVI